MSRFTQLYRTTVGQKAVAAITGTMLFGFVVLHMAGNLKTFTGNAADGEPHVDIYAAFLRTMGEPLLPYSFALWTIRIVMIVAVVLHIGTVVQLAAHNREARNIRYTRHVHAQATWPARSMLISGVLLLGFIVVHILQFTTGTIDVTPIVQGEIYTNLYKAFGEWFFALILRGGDGTVGNAPLPRSMELVSDPGVRQSRSQRAATRFCCDLGGRYFPRILFGSGAVLYRCDAGSAGCRNA